MIKVLGNELFLGSYMVVHFGEVMFVVFGPLDEVLILFLGKDLVVDLFIKVGLTFDLGDGGLHPRVNIVVIGRVIIGLIAAAPTQQHFRLLHRYLSDELFFMRRTLDLDLMQL